MAREIDWSKYIVLEPEEVDWSKYIKLDDEPYFEADQQLVSPEEGVGEPVGARRWKPQKQEEPKPEPEKPTPYRSVEEAADDALNLIEEGHDPWRIGREFRSIGVTDKALAEAAARRGQQWVYTAENAVRRGSRKGADEPAGAGEIKSLPDKTLTQDLSSAVVRGYHLLRSDIAQAMQSVFGVDMTDAIVKAQRDAKRYEPSEQVQNDLEVLSQASWADVVPELLSRPRTLITVLAESITRSAPALAGGLVAGAAGSAIGLGALGVAASRAVGAGIGSLATSYGAAVSEYAADRGIDLTKYKDAIEFFSDKEKVEEASKYGIRYGIPVATFEGISMGLAGKFTNPLVKKLYEGDKITARAVLKAFAKESVAQGALGAAGEAAGSYVAGKEINPFEVAVEMFAGPATSVPEATVSAYTMPKQAAAVADVLEKQRTAQAADRIMSAQTVDEAISIAKEAVDRPNIHTELIADLMTGRSDADRLRAAGVPDAIIEELVGRRDLPEQAAPEQTAAEMARRAIEIAAEAPQKRGMTVDDAVSRLQEASRPPQPTAVEEATARLESIVRPQERLEVQPTKVEPQGRPRVPIKDIIGAARPDAVQLGQRSVPISDVDIVDNSGNPFPTKEAAERARKDFAREDLTLVPVGRSKLGGWEYVLRRETELPGPQEYVQKKRTEASEEAINRLTEIASELGRIEKAEVVEDNDLRDLVEAVNKDRKERGLGQIDMFAVDAKFANRPKETTLASVMAEAVGAPLVFIKTTDKNAFNGLYFRGKMYVSVDAPVALPAVVGHEFLHRIEDTAPDLYAKLVESTLPILKPEKAWYEKYGLPEGSLKPSQVTAEMLADISGDAWLSPDFWRQVASRVEGGTFAKLKRRLLALLDWILKTLKLRGFGSSAFTTNLQKARSEIAKITAAYVNERRYALAESEGAYRPSPRNRIDELFSKENIGRILESDEWAILTAENPNNQQLSDEENLRRTNELRDYLIERGIPFREVFGKYSEPNRPEERSFVILADEKTALDIGRRFGQESILTRKGLVYRDGSYNPATGVSVMDERPDNFYSRVTADGKESIFSVNIDFDKKIGPEQQADVKGSRVAPKQEPAKAKPSKEQEATRPADTLSKEILRALTEEEREQMTRRDAEKIAELWSQLPSKQEVAAVALAGKVKRGWYRRAARAVLEAFGIEAPRFAALLAALSPRTTVELNFENTVRVWHAWHAAGRPRDKREIMKVLGSSVRGEKGEESVLQSWINNAVEVLSAESPLDIRLSGPKVSSFHKNLLGNVIEVTNDAWIAAFNGVKQELFEPMYRKVGDKLVGMKGGGYLAVSARTRQAAEFLSEITGETWTPAEVQETVWSWAKTLYELREAEESRANKEKRKARTTLQLIKDGELTDELIAQAPEFSTLFRKPEFAKLIAESGYRVPSIDGDEAIAKQRAPGEAKAPVIKNQEALIARAAKRLEHKFAGDKVKLSRVVLNKNGPAEGAVTITGVHFSHDKRDVLLGSKFGTGIKGKEGARLQYAPPELKRRVYFYIVEPGQPVRQREAGLGVHAHSVTLGNMYEFGVSPPIEYDRSGWPDELPNKMEMAIIRAGYDGYINRSAGFAVVLNNDVPVKYIGEAKDVEGKPLPSAAVPKLSYSIIDPDGFDDQIDYGDVGLPELEEELDVEFGIAEDLREYRKKLDRSADTLRALGREWMHIGSDRRRYELPFSHSDDLDTVAQVMTGGLADVREAKVTADDVRYSGGFKPKQKYFIDVADTRAIVYVNGKNQVVLNLYMFKQGVTPGAAIYQVVGTWAANSGKVFIGDPAGLSDRAIFRRTVNMFSNALRTQTTRHLAPHQRQLDAGLAWRTGDHEFNIGSMAAWIRDTMALYAPHSYDRQFDAAYPYRVLGSFRPRAGVDPAIAAGGARTSGQAHVTDRILSGLVGPKRAGLVDGTGDQDDAIDSDVGRVVERPFLYSRVAPGFYSELARAVAKGPKVASGKQWAAFLNNLTSKGVSRNELYWSGVVDWAAAQEKATKEDVISFIEGNGVVVRESVLAMDPPPPGVSVKFPNEKTVVVEYEDLRSSGSDLADVASTLADKAIKKAQSMAEGDSQQRLYDLSSRLYGWAEKIEGFGSGAKFFKHSIKSGENYREILLTVPQRLLDAKESGGPFRGKHWTQANVVAHIRANDRVDAEGKRTLFVQEIQSDWAQGARKRGFGKAEGQVPIGPYVTATENWTALALKRVLHIAAEGGYDKLAINRAEYIDRMFPLGAGEERERRARGLHAYYNDIVPKTLRKVAARAGVKDIETVKIEDMELTGISMTEEARNKIKGDGFPLFSRLPPQPPVGNRFMAPEEGRLMRARRMWQDDLLRLRELQQSVKRGGGTLTDANNAYLAAERTPGRILDQMERFEREELRPLLQFLARNDIEPSELALYAYAKHAPERNSYIASINQKIGDAGSGMSNEDAAKIIAEVETSGKLKEFDEAHRMLMRITERTRQLLLDSGLISQDQYEAMELYNYYVPLRGFEDSLSEDGKKILGRGSGFSISGPETLRAKGRRSRAGNIIEQIIADRARTITRAERNLVGKTFLDFVLDNHDPGLWEVNVVTTRPKLVHTGDGLKVVYEDGPDTGDNVFVTKVGGAEVRITLKDKALAESLKKLHDYNALGPVLDVMSTFNRWLSRLLTGMNPSFVVINAPRDFLTAVIQGLRYGKGISAGIVRDWAPAVLAGIRRSYRDTAFEKSLRVGDWQKWDKLLDEYSRLGGRTGFMNLRTISDAHKALMYEFALHGGDVPSSKRFVAKAIKLAELIEGVNNGVEVGARLAAYDAALRAGLSKTQAISIGKNITVNFNRKGQMTHFLQPFFLFINPAIQGAHILFKALEHPKVQMAAAALVGSTIALGMYNLQAGGEDEDGIPYWDKIPQMTKDRNLIIMLPPGDYSLPGVEEVSQVGRYIKIPLPYGINVFSSIGNAMLDLVRHRGDKSQGRNAGRVFVDLVQSAAMSWNPLGGESPMTQMLPAIQPFMQHAFNYNRFGQQLYPDRRGSTPPSELFYEYQRGSASQRLARLINSATGGSEFKEGLISIPPPVLYNYVSYYLGGPGMFIEGALITPFMQAQTRGRVEIDQIPIIRQWYGTVGLRESRRMFAEKSKEATEAVDRLKKMVTAGHDPLPEDEILIQAGAAAEKVNDVLNRLKAYEIMVMNDETLSKEERVRELNTAELRRRQLYSQWLRIWKESVGPAGGERKP